MRLILHLERVLDGNLAMLKSHGQLGCNRDMPFIVWLHLNFASHTKRGDKNGREKDVMGLGAWRRKLSVRPGLSSPSDQSGWWVCRCRIPVGR